MSNEKTHDDREKVLREQFLNELYDNLVEKEKKSRIKVILRLLLPLIIGAAGFIVFLDGPKGRYPSDFMVMKFDQRLNELNKPVMDSIYSEVLKLKNPEEQTRLIELLNQLEQNKTKVSVEFAIRP